MKRSRHQNLWCFLPKTSRQKGLPREKKTKTCSNLASQPQDGTTVWPASPALPHTTQSRCVCVGSWSLAPWTWKWICPKGMFIYNKCQFSMIGIIKSEVCPDGENISWRFCTRKELKWSIKEARLWINPGILHRWEAPHSTSFCLASKKSKISLNKSGIQISISEPN